MFIVLCLFGFCFYDRQRNDTEFDGTLHIVFNGYNVQCFKMHICVPYALEYMHGFYYNAHGRQHVIQSQLDKWTIETYLHWLISMQLMSVWSQFFPSPPSINCWIRSLHWPGNLLISLYSYNKINPFERISGKSKRFAVLNAHAINCTCW